MSQPSPVASDLAAQTAKAFEALSLRACELEIFVGEQKRSIDVQTDKLSDLLIRCKTLSEDNAALAGKNELSLAEAKSQASQLVLAAKAEAKVHSDNAAAFVAESSELLTVKAKQIDALNASIDQRKAELARITKSAANAIKALS